MWMSEAEFEARWNKAGDDAERLDELTTQAYDDLQAMAKRALSLGNQVAEEVVDQWIDTIEHVAPINRLVVELVRAGLAAGLPEAHKACDMLAQSYAESLCESEAMERMA